MFKPRSRVRVEWNGEYYDARASSKSRPSSAVAVEQRLHRARPGRRGALAQRSGGPDARSISLIDDGDASWDKLPRCDPTHARLTDPANGDGWYAPSTVQPRSPRLLRPDGALLPGLRLLGRTSGVQA